MIGTQYSNDAVGYSGGGGIAGVKFLSFIAPPPKYTHPIPLGLGLEQKNLKDICPSVGYVCANNQAMPQQLSRCKCNEKCLKNMHEFVAARENKIHMHNDEV